MNSNGKRILYPWTSLFLLNLLFLFGNISLLYISRFLAVTHDPLVHKEYVASTSLPLNNSEDSVIPKDYNCYCDKILDYISDRHRYCFQKSRNVVEVCLEFSSDYEYLWPFLMHHLNLGFSRIHLYNNEPDATKLIIDPGIGCLAESGLLHIKPWPGDGVQNDIQNDCFKIISDYNRAEHKSHQPMETSLIWGANIDVDEMVVLHNHDCIGKFLDDYPAAPGVVLNWALYPPINITETIVPSLYPHEMLTMRGRESVHIKSLVRIDCFSTWTNPHYPLYKPCNGFQDKAVDVQGRPLRQGKRPPPRLLNYRIAQLNHYWTYSFRHFLRKMHRGESFYTKKLYRSSYEYFQIQNKTNWQLMFDNSFLRKYSKDVRALEDFCPHIQVWRPQLSNYNISQRNTFLRRKLD